MTDPDPPAPLLDVRDLSVTFDSRRGPVHAVDGVSYSIAPGRTLGIVGESGCGKSVTALAILGLIDPPGRVHGSAIKFDGMDLLALSDTELQPLRGARLAMIFQEPMTALNPCFTIGDQIGETLIAHQGLSKRAAWDQAISLLRRVGLAGADKRVADYPHQLSGGMRQRAVIAMALACRPALLIADEPTTALDVTVQAQILELLLELQDSDGMAIQFISHDFGVISSVADTVAVMYAGRIVERAELDELFRRPLHPYTQGLLETVPRIGRDTDRLPAIPGSVPDPARRLSGCAFRNRCPRATHICADQPPPLSDAGDGHSVACFRAAV